MAAGRTNAGGGGTKFATGTIIPPFNSYTVTVTGLPFRPKKIMFMPAGTSSSNIANYYNCFCLYDEENSISEVGGGGSSSTYIWVNSAAWTITNTSFTVNTTANGTKFTNSNVWRWYITD